VADRCSFCGKRRDQVQVLVNGPGGVAICDECVALAAEIVDESAPAEEPREPA